MLFALNNQLLSVLEIKYGLTICELTKCNLINARWDQNHK